MLEQTALQSAQVFFENSAYSKVKRLVKEQTGLDCSSYRDEYVRRRFEIRLRATGTQTFAKYVIYLRKHPEEYLNLLNDLTVNYTTFFRDTDVYEYLEHTLLPKLFLSGKPVKIWSAGCATGEEPYSLAVLVQKLFGHRLHSQQVQIVASDIDQNALGKAQRGYYRSRQLGSLDAVTVKKYFDKENEDYIVKDSIKKLVKFEQFDLNNKPTAADFDLILCRNVMIYFSKEGQQHIHMNFYHALKNGGYMITGKSEILSGEPSEVFVALDYLCRIYQKPL